MYVHTHTFTHILSPVYVSVEKGIHLHAHKHFLLSQAFVGWILLTPIVTTGTIVDTGDEAFIPWSGGSPREGNGNQLQYPCLKNRMDRGAWWPLQSMGRKDMTERLSTAQHSTFQWVVTQCSKVIFALSIQNLLIPFDQRRQWHPTPALLSGKSHGQRSQVGYSPWGRKQSDTTERLHFHFHT